MPTLYLIQTRAAGTYLCEGCGGPIAQGNPHFRHDPHPYARAYRGQKTSHWCYKCIQASNPGPPDSITKRIRVPAAKVLDAVGRRDTLVQPVQIAIFGIAPTLTNLLAADPSAVYSLSPDQFEVFVCDRLYAMGMEPRRVGPTNRKDGGVDVVFWPRNKSNFPFLGAAQVKHHRNPNTTEGPSTVRDFAGVMAGHAFNAGIIVTNTTFSVDAQWFAREHANLLRLRDFEDIRRWMFGLFGDEAEWREIPESIELCPGIVVKLRDF